jgi:hypothetical protein
MILEGRFLENYFIHTCHPFTPYNAGEFDTASSSKKCDSPQNILLSLTYKSTETLSQTHSNTLLLPYQYHNLW